MVVTRGIDFSPRTIYMTVSDENIREQKAVSCEQEKKCTHDMMKLTH